MKSTQVKPAHEQRLADLKNKFESLKYNDLMDKYGGLSSLQSQLSSEQNSYQTSVNQYNNLSNQLSQTQSNFSSTISTLQQLQSKLAQQESSKHKVQSYLNDYYEPSSLLNDPTNDSILKQLIGELNTSNIE